MSAAFVFVVLAWLGVSSQTTIRTGDLPTPQLTPGDTFAVIVAEICVVEYTKTVRSVPASVNHRVHSSYGREPEKGICYEVDHLIPLELGGSNRASNLWPEPYDIQWNAPVKDRLESRLHKLVCDGEIDLPTAQGAIANDWIAYRKYMVEAGSRSKRRE